MLGELEVIKEFEGVEVRWAPASMRSRGLLCAGSAELLHPIFGWCIGHTIMVDKMFYAADRSAQKFFLLHEIGHIKAGDLKSDVVKSAMGVAETHLEHGLHPMEAAADRYAMDRCTVEELKATYRAFLDLAILSIIAPGLKDTRIRAKLVREEIRKRKKAKKLAAIVA